MKQWKQRIACLLAVVMTVTGFFPWNSPVSVHAEESVIKSSADGFEYRLKFMNQELKNIFAHQILRKSMIAIRMRSKVLLIYPERF